MSDPFIAPAWGPAPAPTVGPATSPEPEPPAAGRRVPARLAITLGGALVSLLALTGVLGFWAPGFFVSKVYDVAALQNGVLAVLRDDHQIAAEAVACPSEVPVSEGLRFSCNALVGGGQQPVTVRVLDDDGRFEVARPG